MLLTTHFDDNNIRWLLYLMYTISYCAHPLFLELLAADFWPFFYIQRGAFPFFPSQHTHRGQRNKDGGKEEEEEGRGILSKQFQLSLLFFPFPGLIIGERAPSSSGPLYKELAKRRKRGWKTRGNVQ